MHSRWLINSQCHIFYNQGPGRIKARELHSTAKLDSSMWLTSVQIALGNLIRVLIGHANQESRWGRSSRCQDLTSALKVGGRGFDANFVFAQNRHFLFVLPTTCFLMPEEKFFWDSKKKLAIQSSWLTNEQLSSALNNRKDQRVNRLNFFGLNGIWFNFSTLSPHPNSKITSYQVILLGQR